jgi:DME family drug/metabolite transporter
LFVESLSLFTAFCYGLSAVLVRKGLRDSNPMTGVIVSVFVQVIVISGLYIVSPSTTISWYAIVFFITSGILASIMGRILNYISIERLGVPISATIIGSSPLFSTLFAFLFIGEQVTLETLVGTILVVTGIAVTRLGDSVNPQLGGSTILIPILSAVFYGASSVVRKVGLNILPEATLGALVGATSSLLSFIIYLVSTQNLGNLRLNWKSGKYFVISGVVVSLGWLSMFNALTAGEVSVVSALIGANPLFSLVLSLMLLREADEFDWKVAMGCIAIVAGVTIITLL